MSIQQELTDKLLSCRDEQGVWQGRLSSSALATATAVFTLILEDSPDNQTLIDKGFVWLKNNQNDDGGFGDTDRSFSNLSTSALCWAVFAKADSSYQSVSDSLEKYLIKLAGSLDRDVLAKKIEDRYGKDKTFSIPILTMVSLSGRWGNDRSLWLKIKALPFELAMLPNGFYSFVKLPVVSYALPALIAIGQLRFFKAPGKNPFSILIKKLSVSKTLQVLEKIQPTNGGFLEATPLTSFVCVSLLAMGIETRTTKRCLSFLKKSVREDGSWPIDTNLSTWVTTLSFNAIPDSLSSENRSKIKTFLLDQHFKETHPYTGAAPGAWSWTNLPGAVPDADDTAGALISLWHLYEADKSDESIKMAAKKALVWLLDLQNKNGGIPTFCKGWGHLPFDRSGADLTAHAIRAFVLWREHFDDEFNRRIKQTINSCLKYLSDEQSADGSWLPLWFGSEHREDETNPIYGTVKVMLAFEMIVKELPQYQKQYELAEQFLQTQQNEDGSFGKCLEETALCFRALSVDVEKQLSYFEKQDFDQASPIGFYFAKLWYYEDLYPLIFTLEALNSRARS